MSVSIIANGTEFRVFNRRFAVSNDGRLFHIRTQTIQTHQVRADGYCTAGGKFLVHRMVATCWLPNPEEAKDVHHLNECKTDNRAENLIWVSHKEHMSDHHDFMGRYERTKETRDKLRAYRTGRTTSEGTKAKQREASLLIGSRPPPRPNGFKVSAEASERQSEAHWRNTGCEIDGVRYRSFSEAGRALGIFKMTIRKRCLSPNFPSYLLIES